MVLRYRKASGLSMVEVLLVVVVIAIISLIGLPTISTLREKARRAATIQNAKNISQISQSLAALGVAHVIPDSMGGVSATARLLREGITVTDGAMAGERFSLDGMTDDEIEDVAEFLYVQYFETELQLVFIDPQGMNGTRVNEWTGDILYAVVPGRLPAAAGI